MRSGSGPQKILPVPHEAMALGDFQAKYGTGHVGRAWRRLHKGICRREGDKEAETEPLAWALGNQTACSSNLTHLICRCWGCLRTSSPRRLREGDRLRGARDPLPIVFTVPLGLFCICWSSWGERLRWEEEADKAAATDGDQSWGRLFTFRLLSLFERNSTRGAASVLWVPRLRWEYAGASRKGTGERRTRKGCHNSVTSAQIILTDSQYRILLIEG